jgi:hypothetical protein
MGVTPRFEERFVAGVVTECDVAIKVPSIIATRADIPAFVLIRVFSEPIALLELTLPVAGLSAAELAVEIAARLAPQLRERFEDCGLAWTGEIPLGGLAPPRTPSFLASRELVQRDGPTMTIAICTHERPESLEMTLRSVVKQRYPRYDVLVVDNAPGTDATREVVARLAEEHPAIRYEVEPRPGLSWARNCAADCATGEVVAWVDDDVLCDPWWATEMVRGFFEVPGADVVTGTVVPSELATRSQLMFDRYASVRRRRGFARAVFSAGTPGGQSPLYPMPPFGIGYGKADRRIRHGARRRYAHSVGGGHGGLQRGPAGRRDRGLPALRHRPPPSPTGRRRPAESDAWTRPRIGRLLHQHGAPPAGRGARGRRARATRDAGPIVLSRPATQQAGRRLPTGAAEGEPARDRPGPLVLRSRPPRGQASAESRCRRLARSRFSRPPTPPLTCDSRGSHGPV